MLSLVNVNLLSPNGFFQTQTVRPYPRRVGISEKYSTQTFFCLSVGREEPTWLETGFFRKKEKKNNNPSHFAESFSSFYSLEWRVW
jgi:hypothetical protein